MEVVTFKELYDLYQTANKDNSIKSRNGLNEVNEATPKENKAIQNKMYSLLQKMKTLNTKLKSEVGVYEEIKDAIYTIDVNLEMIETKD